MAHRAISQPLSARPRGGPHREVAHRAISQPTPSSCLGLKVPLCGPGRRWRRPRRRSRCGWHPRPVSVAPGRAIGPPHAAPGPATQPPPSPRLRAAGPATVIGDAHHPLPADQISFPHALAAATDSVTAGFPLDYRGYGGNPGSPTEQGLAADARAAHHHLVADRGVPPARLVLFGESLGAAVATRLAQERPVGGLVLRSPFTSLADVGALHYPLLPVRALLRDRYPIREMVGSITVPITVVAGQADEIAPPAQSRAVASTAAARYLQVPGARHKRPGPELRAGGRRRRRPHGVTGNRGDSARRRRPRGPLPDTTRSIGSPSV